MDPSDLSGVRALFEEYAASRPVSLNFQGFDQELAALPGALYTDAGFREIPPYTVNPVPGARFLELEL